MKKTITINDKMQKNYKYILSEPAGKNFSENFKPELTPQQMLALGVFGGRYMRDCFLEFPLTVSIKMSLTPSQLIPFTL